MGSMKKIKYRSPYHYPTIEYGNYDEIKKKQEQYKKKCDQEIKRLEKKGILKKNALEYLNSLIERYSLLLEGEAKQIYRKNLNSIDNIFKRRSADLIEYEALLRNVQEELAGKETEYEKLESLYKQSNPLEKGQLDIPTIPYGGSKEED